MIEVKSQDKMVTTNKQKHQIARRPILGILVGLLVVAIFGLFISNAQTRLGVIPVALGFGTYSAFYCSLLAVYLLGFLLWQNFASRHGLTRSNREALIDAGLMTVGKYIPGKIWGLMGRGALEGSDFTLDSRRVVISTAEQLVVLWYGASIVGMAWLLTELDSGSSRFNIILLTSPVLAMAPWLASVITQRWLYSSRDGGLPVLPVRSWPTLACGYILLWSINPIPLLVLAGTSIDLTYADSIHLGLAFIASVMAGWVAFFSPAGIGVREAAFVALAPSTLGWESCLYWIALHRTLSTIFDLLLGTLTLWAVSSCARTKRMAAR